MLADPVLLDRIRSQNGHTFHTWIPEHIRICVILLLCKRNISAKNLFRTSEIQELNFNLRAVFWSAVSVNVVFHRGSLAFFIIISITCLALNSYPIFHILCSKYKHKKINPWGWVGVFCYWVNIVNQEHADMHYFLYYMGLWFSNCNVFRSKCCK